jgi:hypothetical protein
MKTVKCLLVAILLMQGIQTAVLWYGLVIYPYEDDDEGDDSGVVLETRLSHPVSMHKIARLTNSLRRDRGIGGMLPRVY